MMGISGIRSKALQVLAALAALVAPAAFAADIDYGKPGTPVHLVVGYQPYYSESWSGVVMRTKEFWKKYLPQGSTVEFQVGLQGAIIVNAMLAGKMNMGYMGDMPAIVSTTKESVADVRIVATVGLGYDQCNIFLVRTDAPKFNDVHAALKWLDGKTVAVPKGSCTDRFAQAVFKKEKIEPSAYLNQNIEVITSGFRVGKLDAAVMWEPTASRLVEEKLARRIASGASVDENDGGFLAMRADLIKQRPDIVKAWLNAELDAQRFVADEKNSEEIARIVQAQTTGFQEKVLWMSLWYEYPKNEGGVKQRVVFPFTIDAKSQELINRATAFLYSIKSINVEKLRAEAVMPQFANEVLKERGATSPIGAVDAGPMSAYKGK